jgi:Flp pilus assembly protein TadG
VLYEIRKFVKRFVRSESGTQLIEFAFVFPCLILLFAGVTELGRLFYTYTTLAKATRAGARYLSTVSSVSNSTTAAKNLVRCGDVTGCGTGHPALVVPNLEESDVVITPPPSTGTGPKFLTVSITGYTYRPVVFDLSAMTGGDWDIALTPSTTMRYMPN